MRQFTNFQNGRVLWWNKVAPWDTAIAMNDCVAKRASGLEAHYYYHWILVNYFIGRDLWIIACVHMSTTT